MFAERYARSLASSDLTDDEHHHATLPLMAAAKADVPGQVTGAMLNRVKLSGTYRRTFEGGDGNLASLLKLWTKEVERRILERKRVPAPRTAWDMQAFTTLSERVAHQSLAYWLDGLCGSCHGTGLTREQRMCPTCGGKKKAPLQGSRIEQDLTLDFVSELCGIEQSHAARAGALLKKRAA